MEFNKNSIVRVLVIIVIAVVLIWAIGMFVPLLGLPGVVVTLLNVIVGIAALVAILNAIGLLK